MKNQKFNIFAGSERGTLKGICLINKLCDNIYDFSKDASIQLATWGQENNIYLGLSNQVINEVNVTLAPLSVQSYNLKSDDGYLKGLEAYEDSKLITCTSNGSFHVWEKKTEESLISFDVGDNIYKMVQDPGRSDIVAMGGKENALKIFNLAHNDPSHPIFQSKNVRNDWLNLRVPIWITDIAFLQSQQIVTSTGHSKLRVYDPSTQKRPVLEADFGEHPITALSLVPDRMQAVVADTQGCMGLVDLRKGKLVHKLRDATGSIRALDCHPTLPLVASCGLDRFVRVHNIDTKELTHKIYCKTRLNCLLFHPSNPYEEGPDRIAETAEERLGEVENEPDDELWDNLDVVEEARQQKRTLLSQQPRTKKSKKAKTESLQ